MSASVFVENRNKLLKFKKSVKDADSKLMDWMSVNDLGVSSSNDNENEPILKVFIYLNAYSTIKLNIDQYL